MRVEAFDFHLPAGLIAVRPAQPRDSARLLVAGADGHLLDSTVRYLPQFLRAGDLLVFNDTRVIPARLKGRRVRQDSDVAVEIMLVRRIDADRWIALARPGKRLRQNDRITFAAGLDATVEARNPEGDVTLRFSLGGDDLDSAIACSGEMPLPPYIVAQRAPDSRDRGDYQTIFARHSGAVAAPTAGLHFTPELLHALEAAEVGSVTVTLHVGAGTFLPVKAEDTAQHRMHPEWGEITPSAATAIAAARAAGGRIVAVGTTALRLLESAAGQDGTVRPFSGETDIFITPGYRFRAVDILMTNFHLPRSTLFMLVCAFVGLERARAMYAHAIGQGYRFYSYGDACLLFGSRT